ncbi:penicillin-binding transpeptidase domain-containing protein [Seleniivibrio sp.]|uniref:transglycosylase domain-containing protein n=1 Tax=Seleniivibrio sp. TaxID=2898801 RepID=UPI0025E4929A|nr:penicillin-binding transpeptidase domain-containing protein [Seleniivibrio sp.]MCD8554073.1 transglycosylase domain-containing protein [Seleniivibrio sp.]
MKFLKVFLVLLFLAAAGAGGWWWYTKNQRVKLELYSPDMGAIFYNDRKTKTVSIYSKDNVLMYKNVYERSDDMPANLPQDIYTLMEFAGKNYFKCEKPETDEDLKLLKAYEIPADGLDDCFVLYEAERAAYMYRDDTHYKLVLWKTAADLLKMHGRNGIYDAYLQTAYMQSDLWGLESASLFYFDRSSEFADESQILWLMSVLTLNVLPYEDMESFLRRTGEFAEYMIEQGKTSYRDAVRVPVEYNINKLTDNYPLYTSLILEELERRGVQPSGEVVITSGLNLDTIEKAKEAIAERMPFLPDGANAVMAVVNLNDGSIEALAANNRFRFRTMQMKRQIGSTFKPMVYLTAFNNGFRPNQLIVDKPYEYKNHGKPYHPANFEDYYMGVIPLRKGLVFSLNNATIRLAMLAELQKVADTAKLMGMNYDVKPYLAMPLGIFPLTVQNVAQVYSVIGNYGVRKDCGLILNIRNMKGEPLYYVKRSPEQIISPVSAYQVLRIMQDVSRIGTARGAGLISGTAAKTGTTDDYKDAWTAAIAPPYAIVAWVGFDDHRSMGDKGTGGGLAAPIVTAFQKRMWNDWQKIDFNIPSGVVLKDVDYYSGVLPSDACRSKRTYTEAFADDNLPEPCVRSAVEPIVIENKDKGQ